MGFQGIEHTLIGHCRIAAGKGRLRHRDQSLLLKARSTLLEENADIREDLDKVIFYFKESAQVAEFTASHDLYSTYTYTPLKLLAVDLC